MTDTSLPYVTGVGGSTDTPDPGAGTWTLSLCPQGNGSLHAARRDSDHLAPVGRRHDSFIKVERNVAGKITRGTDARKQEALDRFFRVQSNNVEILLR